MTRWPANSWVTSDGNELLTWLTDWQTDKLAFSNQFRPNWLSTNTLKISILRWEVFPLRWEGGGIIRSMMRFRLPVAQGAQAVFYTNSLATLKLFAVVLQTCSDDITHLIVNSSPVVLRNEKFLKTCKLAPQTHVWGWVYWFLSALQPASLRLSYRIGTKKKRKRVSGQERREDKSGQERRERRERRESHYQERQRGTAFQCT